MSDYKVSIIMPVYNAQKYLTDSLESIVNQSIGVENLEVIIVNDASTDASKGIIDEYCKRHSNFKAIHLTENIGGAYGPRNVALEHVSSDYVMFLDADDTFLPDACELLYTEILKSGAGVVFGRYNRVYDEISLKSYSPYDSSDNDIRTYVGFGGVTKLVWKVLYRILYGKSEEFRKKVVIDDLSENPEILKILPSIWTKIIRRDKCSEFEEFISGEDLNFILDAYFNSKIVFLNDEVITNYHMRFGEDLSITKNVKYRLVLDTIRAYKLAVEKVQGNGLKANEMINPFLLNYINLIRQADFSADEKKELKKEVSDFDKIYKNKGLMGFLFVKMIKRSI